MSSRMSTPIILNCDERGQTIQELIKGAKSRLIEVLDIEQYLIDADITEVDADGFYEEKFSGDVFAHVWVHQTGSWEEVRTPQPYHKVLLMVNTDNWYFTAFILKPEKAPDLPILYVGNQDSLY